MAEDGKFPEVDHCDQGELFESHASLLANENVEEFSQLTKSCFLNFQTCHLLFLTCLIYNSKTVFDLKE